MTNPIGIIAGVLVLVGVGVGVYFASSSMAPTDPGAGTKSEVSAPNAIPPNEQMKPVTPEEANRRATVNQEDAQKAADDNKSYQAPSVISGVGPADRGEMPKVDTGPKKEPEERVVREVINRTEFVYRVPVQQPVNDQEARQRVQAQLDALVQNVAGDRGASQIMGQRYYEIGERRNASKPGNSSDGGNGNGNGNSSDGGNGSNGAQGGNGSGQSGSAQRQPPPPRMVARAGDVIFARLDRAFNSDDPGAPIIVSLDDVIFDPQRGSKNGPLTGMRLIGSITYSQDQAAIMFNRLVTNTGQQVPITAIAVSEKDARTGVAAHVNYHTLQRYSGLLAAGMIQGVGEVGQQLLANNRNYTITPAGTVISGSNGGIHYGQAAAAAVAPLGSALASAAAQNFNRPPTFSSPAGMGLGVVFLSPVLLPPGSK